MNFHENFWIEAVKKMKRFVNFGLLCIDNNKYLVIYSINVVDRQTNGRTVLEICTEELSSFPNIRSIVALQKMHKVRIQHAALTINMYNYILNMSLR